MFKINKTKSAFTLIELLVVIAIIGLLASISVIALNSARARTRDTKRVGDIKQITTALEMFFNDAGRYPTDNEFNSGTLSYNGQTYLSTIPTAPNPPDGTCDGTTNAFTYSQINSGDSYELSFCISSNVGSLASGGEKCATPAGFSDAACGGGGGGGQVSTCLSTPGNCSWADVGQTNISSGLSPYVFGAAYNGVPYVIFTNPNSSNRAKVMKYENSSWQVVGVDPNGFSNGTTAHVKLAFSSTGTLYAAFRDDPAYLPRVYRFNGTDWDDTGVITNNSSNYLSFFVYNTTPYLAYTDSGSGNVKLSYYDGSSWQDIGGDVSSSGSADYLSLYVYNGIPYVAYRDWNLGGSIMVRRYYNSAWEDVGSVLGVDQLDSFVISVNAGTPYVAFANRSNYFAYLMRFDGSNWQYVGGVITQTQVVGDVPMSLQFYNNIPYLAYSLAGGSNDYKVSVSYYDNGSWQFLNSEGVSNGYSYYPCLSISLGTPYLVYSSNADGGVTMRQFVTTP